MKKTALLFAGQGAQEVGMGRELAKRFPAVMDRLGDPRDLLGFDLASVCFDGPEDVLTQTEHAQPGILYISWLAYEILREQVPNLEFQATAGLSLGEFSALAGAGALTFKDALWLVHQRGRFMQEACEETDGTMAAVIGLDTEAARQLCDAHGIEIANLNCPGQIVISGDKSAVEKACEDAKGRGAKRAMPLSVAGAYHSKLMASASNKLKSALNQVALTQPAVPVISNVTASPYESVDEIRSRLVEQVTSPVLWEKSVRRLLDEGVTRFIELGPGKTLTGFMKRIDKSAETFNVNDLESLETTVNALT